MDIMLNCTAIYFLGLWVMTKKVKIRTAEDMATVVILLATLHGILLFGFIYWGLTLPI